MAQNITSIKWQDSFWFFDIDDTLIDTAGTNTEAASGIQKVFLQHFSQQEAENISQEFIKIFNHMLAGYRVRSEDDWKKVEGGKEGFDLLLKDVENCQQRIKEQFGAIKKWSREVFIKIAADRLHLHYSPEMIHEAADAYWLTLTEKTTVFPHALQIIQEIKKHARPIYLITSSDARLKYDGQGQFDYIPSYSEGLKRERIELLREKGVDFNIVSIGDPEDKPHLDFFEKGIKKAEEDLGMKIDLSNSVMCGDSFAGDLQTPKEQLGFGIVALMQKGKETTEVIDQHQVDTGNLYEVANFLI